MDVTCDIFASVYCYTLMTFYLWPLLHHHFSCCLVCVCGKELEYLDMTINVKNHHACVSAQDIILNAAALQLVMVEKYCGEIR